ncbi:alginate lyase family protein [Bosea sp. (in: a-proteobacteria)]|uniref:heparinase II/III family protein n=1 Tax=Bosea sp. (in: a-proteobacteria) TaxID=1871050 RepID=UPI00260FC215|nr:alginate lyase family protein [Bosea sp. (in: a-proteobacteria)]MCO5091024.1 heparinase II/III family protein [Bosea sp. (in: a-proteobacteria)]
MLHRLHLYWETLRHLRPVQFHGRLRFRLARPRPDLRPAPPRRVLIPEGWAPPACRRPSQTGPDRFCFLNETHTLAECGWDDPTIGKLWRYNLHYFDDLNAEGAGERRSWHEQAIARWIAENPPGRGTGWEPYPTSLRIVNWIKWVLAGNALSPDGFHSLAVQTRWLTRRLEYHLLGNHLFANAKALVFAGVFFAGPEADSWLAQGLSILAREIPEQILPDGGQFELSPMYHALALEDMLDLVNLLRSAGSAIPAGWREVTDWPERIAAMRGWLAAMCHPDGEIAFFNDAAIGIAPSPAELERYAARLNLEALPAPGTGATWLRDSGYIRLATGPVVALLDVARIGPDYLPGHAHADTLSFEMSLAGQRMLVNAGTSEYGGGPERLRQRGTAAHNTVSIGMENSSEVWSGFRVARRARPQGLTLSGDGATISCGHDGYERLPGRPRHLRTWQADSDRLIVTDRIEGGRHDARARFHLHPDVTVSEGADPGTGLLARGPDAALRWRVLTGSHRIVPSSWHPEFGITRSSRCLEVELRNGESMVEFSWSRR